MTRLFVASGIFHPEPGGPSTYLYGLLPALQSRDWDIRVLSYGDSPTSAYPYPLTRIARTRFPLRLLNYARAARPMLNWADLVYAHTIDLPLWGRRRAPRIIKIVGDQAWERCIRKGWIAPDADIDAFQQGSLPPLADQQRRSRAQQVRAMDGVIVPSQYLKQMVMGWGVPEDHIHVIYNAIPLPAVELPTRGEARTELGLGNDPLLLTAARLEAWKGAAELITALPPGVRLLIAGDGPELPHLKQQAAPLGDRVRFMGRISREQLHRAMRAVDYVALYSGYEGLPHTLLESLRAGTPVIASDKGGNPEVVQHGVNGLLVSYANSEALAATLHEAFAPGLRAQLAANSSHGLERFDFARMVEQTDAVLRTYL